MKPSRTMLVVSAVCAAMFGAGAHAVGGKAGMATDFTLNDFMHYDRNGDGFLSKDGLARIPESERTRALAMDANRDDRLSKPEVSDWADKGARMADPAGRDRGVLQAEPAAKDSY